MPFEVECSEPAQVARGGKFIEPLLPNSVGPEHKCVQVGQMR